MTVVNTKIEAMSTSYSVESSNETLNATGTYNVHADGTFSFDLRIMKSGEPPTTEDFISISGIEPRRTYTISVDESDLNAVLDLAHKTLSEAVAQIQKLNA